MTFFSPPVADCSGREQDNVLGVNYSIDDNPPELIIIDTWCRHSVHPSIKDQLLGNPD
jgi:hypothetical protein